MSYDLVIAEKSPDEDWDTVLDRLETAAMETSELSEERRGLWETIARRIVENDPAFEQSMGPSYVEVTHPDLGIQVFFHQDEAAVSVPYWYSGHESAAVMTQVGAIVDSIIELSGWSVWDPQLDSEISSGAELGSAAQTVMSDTSARLPGLLHSAKKPWWKFWSR